MPVLTIGRAPTNQVVLSDYHLSGEHGTDLPRGRSLHLSRPALDQRLAHPARRRRGGARRQRALGDAAARRRQAPARQPGRPGGAAVPRAASTTTRAARSRRSSPSARMSELPEVQGQHRARSERAAALYKVAKKLGRRGLDLQRGVRGHRRGDRSSWCRAPPTSRWISPTSPTAGSTPCSSRAKGRRRRALPRQPRGGAPRAARQGRA